MSDGSTQLDVTTPKWMLWTGRVLSALVVLMLAFSASMKLRHSPEVVTAFVHDFGYQEASLVAIGIVELACLVLYAIPQTSILGAILVTGYLGGAVVTHLRVGQPFFAPIILGIVAWAGLFAREPRLRSLIPLRRLP